MKSLAKVTLVCCLSSLIGHVLAADAPKKIPANAANANLQLIMLTKVNPQALALWDITNNATNDQGEVDAKKVTTEQWTALLEIGKSLEEGGRLLSMGKVIAAEPGAKLQDEGSEGASTAKDVQRYLDAKPSEFRIHALTLQKTGTGVIEAATKQDAKKLTKISGDLDSVCENCHVAFWYPQQMKQ